jgi:hypothetical protein
MNDGYGQHYQNMYSGSMIGSGAVVFAVWGYVIANTDYKTSMVRLNEILLSTIIGEPVDLIANAIQKLCDPDPRSNRPDEDGRRLMKRGEWDYFVVNFKHYHGLAAREKKIRDDTERTQRIREEKKNADKSCHSLSSAVGCCSPSSSCASVSDTSSKESDFNAFWTSYPRKVGRKAALKAWHKATDKPALAVILAAVERQNATDQWRKDGGQYIPMPATWLNQGRWADEPVNVKPIHRGSAI